MVIVSIYYCNSMGNCLGLLFQTPSDYVLKLWEKLATAWHRLSFYCSCCHEMPLTPLVFFFLHPLTIKGMASFNIVIVHTTDNVWMTCSDVHWCLSKMKKSSSCCQKFTSLWHIREHSDGQHVHVICGFLNCVHCVIVYACVCPLCVCMYAGLFFIGWVYSCLYFS